MKPRKQPIRVLQSPLSGNFYVVTRYKDHGNGIFDAITQYDVTKDVQTLIDGAIRDLTAGKPARGRS